jgi:sec-independent protein translocase protein TatA
MPVFAVALGPTELIVVLVIVLILFGAGRLPQVFRSVGDGLRQFRDAQKEDPRDVTPPRELDERAVQDADELREKDSERVRR